MHGIPENGPGLCAKLCFIKQVSTQYIASGLGQTRLRGVQLVCVPIIALLNGTLPYPLQQYMVDPIHFTANEWSRFTGLNEN